MGSVYRAAPEEKPEIAERKISEVLNSSESNCSAMAEKRQAELTDTLIRSFC